MESDGDACITLTGRARDEWIGVIDAARTLLAQCEEFVRRLPDGAYTFESTLLRGGTIGKHLRHLIDHYEAIAQGVSDGRVIDYDHRERDVPVERCPCAALASLGALRASVEAMSARNASSRVRVRLMISHRGDEAVLESSLARELAFVTHHAVHHQAMMRAIACECGVSAAAEGFGVAPSTAHHHAGRTST